MKRRDYLKSIFALGALSVTSFSVFEWVKLTRHVDAKQILDKRPIIAELAEMIIPRTDTPGAKETGVGDFIVKMIKDCSSVKTQNNFIDGLKDLHQYSHREYNKTYLQCTNAEQGSILSHFEKKDKSFNGILGKIQRRLVGETFFSILKGLTVEGYCTSQLGATQALAYVYIPGSFQGCIDMKPGQKAWATNY